MLPSKKVLSIFIVIAALVMAIIIGFGRDKASSAINYTGNLVAGEKVSMPENPNWQNELSGIIPLAQSGQNATGENTSAPSTVTDTVSTSFTANYLALKESGKFDSASAQKLVDQTVSYINQTSVKTSDITQLNVIADNGKQSIMDYGENLGNIAKNKKPTAMKEEIALLMQVIQSGDESKINELDGTIASYEKITAELIKMPVPKTFVKVHLDVVNGVNGMALAFKEMKNVFSDPFRGLSALQLYQDSTTKLSRAMNAIVVFIKKNNVVYKQGSGGYYLINGI